LVIVQEFYKQWNSKMCQIVHNKITFQFSKATSLPKDVKNGQVGIGSQSWK